MNPKSDFPWPFAHVDKTTLVKTGAGALHSIVVNGLTTAGDATVYDGVDNTGNTIAILHLDPTTSISVQPITFLYDAKIVNGIYIEYDQSLAADLTVTYI
jgi:hypothetical protein